MAASGSKNPSIPKQPPTPLVYTNHKISSLFKRAVAADKRSAARNHAHGSRRGRYHLSKELGKKIILIVTMYSRGRHLKCNRCGMRLTLPEALKRLKACAVCRGKSALNIKEWRAAKTAEKDDRAPKKKGKSRARSLSISGQSRASSAALSFATNTSGGHSNPGTPSLHESDDEGAAQAPDQETVQPISQGPTLPVEQIATQDNSFENEMKFAVQVAYSAFKQIDFDGRKTTIHRVGDTVPAVMSQTFETFRKTLYTIWPSVRQIQESKTVDAVQNSIVHINVYDCRCWARGATVHSETNPSEECGGRVYISVTKCKVGMQRAYEIRIKFEHVALLEGTGQPSQRSSKLHQIPSNQNTLKFP